MGVYLEFMGRGWDEDVSCICFVIVVGMVVGVVVVVFCFVLM